DAATWRAAGLTPADRTAIAGLVEIYNRGNLTNLLLLTALRQSLDGQQPAASKGASTTAPDPLPAPPPLPRLDALAPGIAALVEGLAARHPGGVVPSLYLHLAHWPQLLAALPAWAGELIEPGAIVAARDATLRLAAMEAATLRPALDGLEAGKPGQPALAAIERFTQQVIPAMVPVGLGLRRLLAQP
ncbi:MAG: hypothetical protein JWP04_3343, partial [Belnapia sp.]|nr:hypothetical protein [Belnapia sp.]